MSKIAAATRLGRSMWVLLAGILVFHAGWYMLLPFFAVLFTTRRGLSPAEVGLVLAVQSLSLLVGSLVGGMLADRLGRKATMVLGLGLRAAGVGLLGLVAGLPAFLGAAAVAGLGGGLYGPACKAAIAMLAEEGNRTTAFSMRSIAANMGTSGGPLLGALPVGGAIPVLFGAAAVLHVALGVVTWALLGEEGALEKQARGGLRDMLQDLPFMAFSLVTVLAWALFAQLAISVPLYASRVLGLEAMIGLVWTVTSLTVIALQYALSRHVLARMHPMTAMAAGVALLGAGLGLVGFTRSFAGLVGAVLVFVVGEMFLLPTVDSTVSLMARGGAVGSYFGIASFAWGLGEGLGNLSGGALMGYGFQTGRLTLPWLTYAIASAGVGAMYLALRGWTAMRRSLGEVKPAEVTRPQLFRPGYPAPDEGVVVGGRKDGEE